jgi:hypothetical protein
MQAQQQYPALSIRHLCSVLEVNRAWYYASQREQTGGDPDVALRDGTLADRGRVCRLWLSSGDARTQAEWRAGSITNVSCE